MVNIVKGDSTTFAEYLLLPRLTKKDCIPENVSLRTPLSRYSKGNQPNISLNIPFTSASMQSVTGPRMGIAFAQHGGLGFIYCSQPIESQAEMVAQVKNEKAGFVKPKTLGPDQTVEDASKRAEKEGHSIYPIVDSSGVLLGSVNVNYLRNVDGSTKLSDIMRKFVADGLEHIVSSMKKGNAREIIRAVNEYIPYAYAGINLKEANNTINDRDSKFLAIINRDNTLDSLVFRKDIQEHLEHPNELVDGDKRYIAAAGINTHDYKERVPALAKAGVDVVCVDSSDGFTKWQRDCIRFCKKEYPDIMVIGGNIVTGEAFKYLVKAGADAIKVGMGGGAICITRKEKGVGRGQAEAVRDVCETRDRYFENNKIYVPVISDGGIVTPSHVTIALAFGADAVMCGRMFAGAEESAAPFLPENKRIKAYWGEGSNRARNWQRYGEGEGKLKFEEGVDGYVPFAGRLKENILDDIIDRVVSSMVNCGSKTIGEFHKKAILQHVSPLSIKEGGAHDIMMSEDLGTYAARKWGLEH